jgi:hypothetical protein
VFERESAPLERHGQEWIRTTEGVKPADLQSAPFGRFGTYPDFLFARQFEFRDCCPKCRDSRAMGASYIELWQSVRKRIFTLEMA